MEPSVQVDQIEPIQQAAQISQPYPPSFLDRFMNRIRRLPFPFWLTYLVLFLLQVTLNHILSWIDGWLPPFTLSPLGLIFPMWQWGTLAIMTYLNAVSKEVLDGFSPLLNKDKEGLNRLKYEFTTMPSRGVVFSGLLWAFFYIAFTYVIYDGFYVRLELSRLYSIVIFIEGLITFFTGSAIYYHSIRQLILVNRTLGQAGRFNLFHLEPVYAFSRLTSRTGISWMVLMGLTLWMFPIQYGKGMILALLIFQVLLAMMAFVLPLRVVNQHLVAEKRRLLSEHNQKVELTLERLHQSVADNDSDAERITKSLEGLRIEREILDGIPTFPWRAGTLTAFLSASALSIVPLLVQIMVERLLK